MWYVYVWLCDCALRNMTKSIDMPSSASAFTCPLNIWFGLLKSSLQSQHHFCRNLLPSTAVVAFICDACLFEGWCQNVYCTLSHLPSAPHSSNHFIHFYLFDFPSLPLLFLSLSLSIYSYSHSKIDKPIALKCQREMIVLRIVSLLQFILIWMYILLPLLELFTDVDAPNKPFPYKMRFPYDANHGSLYALTYFLTSLAGFGVVTTLFSEDSLFGFFTSHTCGQFRLLHQRIDGIMRTGQLNATKHYSGKLKNGCTESKRMACIQHEYRQVLVKIIRHHNVLIRYVTRIRPIVFKLYSWRPDFVSPLFSFLLLVCLQILRAIAGFLQSHITG